MFFILTLLLTATLAKRAPAAPAKNIVEIPEYRFYYALLICQHRPAPMSAPMPATATPLPQDQPGSQTEGAYWRLREEIICGNLAPSTKLRIDQLRKTYGFGASALREALSRLAADGLADSEPQRGYWVAPISREELNDITVARRTVEVEALRQSIRFGTLEWESGIVAASHSLERVETSLTQPTPDAIAGWERANRQFHVALIAGCPSRWLLRFTASLYDQWQRYRHRTVLRRAIPRRGLSAEHKEIIKLTLEREADAACAALSAHIENTARTAEAAIFESIPIKAAPNSMRRRPAKA
jgi:GntR family transcriptional regulator, carbon starvation induced regulator